jgi:hypothetical protein
MINNANDDYIDLDHYEPFKDVDLCADSDSFLDAEELNNINSFDAWKALPELKRKQISDFFVKDSLEHLANCLEFSGIFLISVLTAIWMIPVMIVMGAFIGVSIAFKSLCLVIKRRGKK